MLGKPANLNSWSKLFMLSMSSPIANTAEFISMHEQYSRALTIIHSKTGSFTLIQISQL